MAWALDKVIVYRYRKEFGLSWQEFLDEDIEQFAINNIIINNIADLERSAQKASEKGIR